MFNDFDKEERIVWLRDPLQFSYLREGVYATTQRRGPISSRRISRELAFIVGYAECVSKKEESGWPTVYRVYRRRFWWLKKHDRDLDPNGVYAHKYPAEAVDPTSIAPNKKSRSLVF